MTELLEQLNPPQTAALHAAQRAAANQQLQRLGLPDQRSEAWKYTPLRPLSTMQFDRSDSIPETALRQLAAALVEPHDQAADDPAAIIVIAGDQCLLEHTPDWVQSMAELLRTDTDTATGLLQPDAQVREQASDSFIWMNLAQCNNGVMIAVPPGMKLDQPLHIVYADPAAASQSQAAASANHIRVHIHCGEASAVTVIEHFVHAGASFSNIYRSMEVDEHASLDLLQLRAAGDATVMIEHSHILQQASSSCRLWALDTGGRLSRQEVRCALQGKNADFAHHGLLLGHGRRHMDQHVMAHHSAGDCRSRQLFRSVLADKSRAVVNTAALVGSGADGSDVQQHTASVLLSTNAEMDAKPQLEILTDEVVASHGATIGQLDDDALFYLRSRGLTTAQARTMLLRGFVQTVLDTLPEALRIAAVERVVAAQLELLL